MLKWVVSAIGVVLVLSAAAPVAGAQEADQDTGGASIADVAGPGQAVPQPPAQCPRTIGCQYVERNLVRGGYRLQSLEVCGANCTSQYWVASLADGQPVLEIDPVRGGAILAVGRATAAGSHPPLRVVVAMYTPADPACCPSAFSDTTYTWDAASNTLVAGAPVVTPADQFPGYAATRQELTAEGWIVADV